MLERRRSGGGARVTSIIDLPDVTADTAQRIARTLTAARASQTAHAEDMSLEVVHDPARRHLKVLMVGSLGDTEAMLKMIDVLAEG